MMRGPSRGTIVCLALQLYGMVALSLSTHLDSPAGLSVTVLSGVAAFVAGAGIWLAGLWRDGK